MTTKKPVVLVPACHRMLGDHPFHVVGRKYVDAVRLAGALPLVVPGAMPDEIDALLDMAHGVLLTGSPSNVHPSHYGESVHNPALPLDPQRDAWTLPLVPRVIARGMPLFAICRGAQEANVALGGSLHQAVHELDPYDDHRAGDHLPAEQAYAPAHEVEVIAGGLLSEVLDRCRFEVNSLHGQAVNQLAPGLRVEARAHDGLVEAFSVVEAKGFNLCVQWHPEWQAASNPVSMQMLQAFGQACRAYRDRHRSPIP
ncbi:MAG: gamma-glutamyl-gamma-aminobutyrate hydrolase family protein [Aquabacterium sp.]|nr:gamma-glutamyl-gamma-aminobutyrate hydrolase family protein [Aquabacterium sp.]